MKHLLQIFGICRRFLFPEDVIAAHDDGIIHVHDLDYIAEPMHNCCLVNLEDMLQNGTVVSGTMIEKPHSFSTACNIATQIIAQVASNQYGGQTISLAHLAPFVEVSRQKILWQNGALARLKDGEVIDDLLYHNYSTISLGHAGIAEMTYRMTGCSHTEPEGKDFALKVMRFLNDKCSKWRAETNISFSLYGTPMESLTYKFAQCLQRRHGIIPHVTDKNYITNSYHVHVTEPIDAFSKLSFEAEFQELSPGGAISYVEVPNLQNNIPAVLALMRHIYETIFYAELNTKSDYCQVCGYNGEIQIVDEDGKLIWECPNCGNRDQRTLNVCRRTCGYLGTQFWNQGRTAEIKDRVMHL